MDSAKTAKENGHNSGWSSYLGSAAGTVKDYSYSAASSIGNTSKAVWNSDAVASTSSAIKSSTVSAASTIGSSAKAAWNSEAVASTSSTVSSGVSSATSGVKSWWKGGKAKENKDSETSGDSIRGGIAAMSKNASNYVVSTAGRSSNILNIFDKTNRSSLGNPRWWIRFDRPHGNVDFNHININKAVTGLKDPHIQISSTTAKTVGALGKVAEKANVIAPILTTAAMIYEAYRIGTSVKKDYDHGTTRNTIQTVATTTGAYTSGMVGAGAGGAIGTTIFPGLGTIFGAVIGGVAAGIYGGYYSHVASEMMLNHAEWDLARLECNSCKQEYTWKKYQEIKGVCCTPFNSKRQ